MSQTNRIISKASRPCKHPGCRQISAYKGYCEQHKADGVPWAQSADKRLFRGRKLQKERKILFDDQPLCVMCEAEGRVSVATIRDHIIPLAEGGRDVRENTQGVCSACHEAKTKDESKRGRG